MSTLRTFYVLTKLLPSIFALRKDRKKWIKLEKNQIDSEQFRKNARKILNTFISLGPVYIKLGQWLSSRADILPQPYLEELSKLQDSVPSAPFEQVKPIIEKDLGPINEKFDEIIGGYFSMQESVDNTDKPKREAAYQCECGFFGFGIMNLIKHKEKLQH